MSPDAYLIHKEELNLIQNMPVLAPTVARVVSAFPRPTPGCQLRVNVPAPSQAVPFLALGELNQPNAYVRDNPVTIPL